MWSEKTRHMVQNWYFELFDSMSKFELFSFQKFLLGSPLILVSKVTDVQRPLKIKKNIRIMMLISFILQFLLLRHVAGFHRSHALQNVRNNFNSGQCLIWINNFEQNKFTSCRLPILQVDSVFKKIAFSALCGFHPLSDKIKFHSYG